MSASIWVQRFASLVPSGAAVLDVACGGGRHLRFFRDRGHPVVGIDRDLSGVADLSPIDGVQLIEADLENGSPFPLANRRFGGVVVTNYLHRPLLPAIAAAVAPGGVLLYETFAVGHERYGRPDNPDFLLRDGELLDLVSVSGLSVVAYETMLVERATGIGPVVDDGDLVVSKVQRLAAVAY